ncbi:MAG: hypothetical protein AB7R89_28820 [Dehalococcoidia bacterium]
MHTTNDAAVPPPPPPNQAVRAYLSRLGRYRASRRELVRRRCQVCDDWFVGLTLARYCSQKCRSKAWRGRANERAVTALLQAMADGGADQTDADAVAKVAAGVVSFDAEKRRRSSAS